MKKNIELFKVFFKIGLFTFGGGFAMIPLIEEELVVKKKWIKSDEIINIFAVAQSIPGAIAINTSTLVGYKVNKKIGALSATVGVIIPSFVTIMLIASFFRNIEDSPIVKAAFKGISAAVIILILSAGIKIIKTFKHEMIPLVMTVVTVGIVLMTTITPVFLIIFGGVIGAVLMRDKKDIESVERNKE